MQAITQPADRRAFSNLRHGLTGRIYLFTQEDQNAFDELTRSMHQEWNPQGAQEAELVTLLISDSWRLRRAATFESSIFYEGAEKFAASPDATGDPAIDHALSQGRTWLAEARNLNLLSLYEGRISRRYHKNIEQLQKLQSERRARLDQATEEAVAYSLQAQSNHEEYDPAESFRFHGFVFSTVEIERMVNRRQRLWQAQRTLKSLKTAPVLAKKALPKAA